MCSARSESACTSLSRRAPEAMPRARGVWCAVQLQGVVDRRELPPLAPEARRHPQAFAQDLAGPKIDPVVGVAELLGVLELHRTRSLSAIGPFLKGWPAAPGRMAPERAEPLPAR